MANRLTDRVKIPVALLVLVGAAVAVNAQPALHAPSTQTVQRVITLALVLVLFDSGMFSRSAAPIELLPLFDTQARKVMSAAVTERHNGNRRNMPQKSSRSRRAMCGLPR